jgi:hypothetical protein
VICNEGYQCSLAAATLHQLGLVDATDVIGGFQAWKAAGLRVRPAKTARATRARRHVRGPRPQTDEEGQPSKRASVEHPDVRGRPWWRRALRSTSTNGLPTGLLIAQPAHARERTARRSPGGAFPTEAH